MLRLLRLGDTRLRQGTRILKNNEIMQPSTQQLIKALQEKIATEDFGVGLAAPQVGRELAIAVIAIKPTKLRPDVALFSAVIINPQYDGIGRRKSMWEGCLSTGTGHNTLFAKALRYQKIHATWIDETGVVHSEDLSGLPAHVFQHETDHLNGILFVDLVRDSKTYMLSAEYRKKLRK